MVDKIDLSTTNNSQPTLTNNGLEKVSTKKPNPFQLNHRFVKSKSVPYSNSAKVLDKTMNFIRNMLEKNENMDRLKFEYEDPEGSKFKIDIKVKGETIKGFVKKCGAVYQKFR